jgi:hypothetical protein
MGAMAAEEVAAEILPDRGVRDVARDVGPRVQRAVGLVPVDGVYCARRGAGGVALIHRSRMRLALAASRKAACRTSRPPSIKPMMAPAPCSWNGTARRRRPDPRHGVDAVRQAVAAARLDRNHVQIFGERLNRLPVGHCR